MGEIVSTGKRRSTSELARDRKRISGLYLRGRLQIDIAKEIGLSRATVSRDIKALHRIWLRSALIDFDTAKANELAKIDALEQIYYDAWDRSREDAETQTQKMMTDGKGKGAKSRKEMTKTAKGQVGDPRFLDGLQWCSEQRLKIFGIYAPTKVEVRWRDELAQAGIDADDIFEKTVNEYIAALQAGETPASG